MSHGDPHADRRARLADAIAHTAHHLPNQAPIHRFVHHNTLHGDQHLHFEEAVEASRRRTGARGYWPEEAFRAALASGRIDDGDLRATLSERLGAAADVEVAALGARPITAGELSYLALARGLDPIPPMRLRWNIAELGATERVADDVPPEARARLLGGRDETGVVRDLWAACAATFGTPVAPPHPEVLAASEAGRWDTHVAHEDVVAAGEVLRAELIDAVGVTSAHLAPWAAITGVDLDARVHELLIRRCASFCDEGVARWSPIDRRDGLWTWFRRTVSRDRGLVLEGHHALGPIVAALSDDPLEALATLLDDLSVPLDAQAGDVEHTALRLPGWAGMAGWHDQNPKYPGQQVRPYDLASFLAVRVAIERAVLDDVVARELAIPPTLGALDAWCRENPDALVVRVALFRGRLPASLDGDARALTAARTRDPAAWRRLSGPVLSWDDADGAGRTAHADAWPLFRLAQLVGADGDAVRRAGVEACTALVDAIGHFDASKRGPFWIEAYERHYRERFLHGIASNRGRFPPRTRRPTAQVITCIDDREESFHRHLNELAPDVETFGFAGFYGVAMRYLGLGETVPFAQCPVTQDPPFLVVEEVRPGAVEAPLSLGERLMAKAGVAPRRSVATRLAYQAEHSDPQRSPEHPQRGFTDVEQADRVEAALRQMGLVGFARLVVPFGHGGSSRNNPHFAAYDCGACSGRHGGPNARLFAAMLNRPAVRAILRERGLDIPDDTVFLGADHDTTSEAIVYFDLEDLPESHRPDFERLRQLVELARRRSAHERARKFESAPKNADPDAALAHVSWRSRDFSQSRPELGHANNAACLVGRRIHSEGLFLDRRVYLVSYDPTTDPDGTALEPLLLAAGPVGAGISLEYYFSSVDPERYGCGTKVQHNLSGMVGVITGARSDLRTGLPRQMTEIHEPMRMLLVVEATTETLTRIHGKVAAVRELVDNAWIVLVALHPETGAIDRFLPGKGWVAWTTDLPPIPHVASSADWYEGRGRGPLDPAIVGEPFGPIVGDVVADLEVARG